MLTACLKDGGAHLLSILETPGQFDTLVSSHAVAQRQHVAAGDANATGAEECDLRHSSFDNFSENLGGVRAVHAVAKLQPLAVRGGGRSRRIVGKLNVISALLSVV